MEASSEENNESSGYAIVSAETGYLNKYKRRPGTSNADDRGLLNMNRKMAADILSLQEKLQRTIREVEREKSQLVQQHTRKSQTMERENFRLKSTLSNVKGESDNREAKHAREIEALKGEIQKLEKESEDWKKELSEAKQLNEEHSFELQNMQGYMDDIEKLKEQLRNVETYMQDKDKLIAEKTQSNVFLKGRMDRMSNEMSVMKESQKKLVDGQKELKKGQDEMMKMMKVMCGTYKKQNEGPKIVQTPRLQRKTDPLPPEVKERRRLLDRRGWQPNTTFRQNTFTNK